MYFFTPAENLSVFVGAVTAVMLDAAIETGYDEFPTTEASDAGFPLLSFAVIVRVAKSPGT